MLIYRLDFGSGHHKLDIVAKNLCLKYIIPNWLKIVFDKNLLFGLILKLDCFAPKCKDLDSNRISSEKQTIEIDKIDLITRMSATGDDQ